MAQIVPIVSVLNADSARSIHWRAQELAQEQRRSGRAVHEVLSEAGATNQIKIFLDDSSKALFARAAQLPGNSFLAEVASLGYVTVDVSSLKARGRDDRVLVGFEINWTEAESKRLGLTDPSPQGPRIQS